MRDATAEINYNSVLYLLSLSQISDGLNVNILSDAERQKSFDSPVEMGERWDSR